MDEKLWQAYIDLQTVQAYGDSFARANEGDVQINAQSFTLSEIIAKVPFDKSLVKSALVIGPGSVAEPSGLKNTFPGASIYVLTAHKPEYEHIKSLFDCRLGDMHSMPFPNSSMNFIFSSNVLEHSFAPYIALMECRRLIHPQGGMYVAIPSFSGKEGGKGPFHISCLSEEVWRELFFKTGWCVHWSNILVGAEDPTASYFQCFLVPTVVRGPHEFVFNRVCSIMGERYH